jgi:3-methyl-2-oxobutanoate hydroxymethyltransferase
MSQEDGATYRSKTTETHRKVTAPGIQARKLSGEKIVALTAYDYPTGVLCEAAGMDLVLVGDSLGNTALGYENTLPVTMDEMLAALRAVRRAVRRPLLVADLPFGSYHVDPSTTIENAIRLLKSGAEAVKLEGGRRRAALVRQLVENETPVMAHIGLTPQSVHAMGGFKVQGRSPAEARSLIDDALALEEAGAFSIVLEGVPVDLAATITEQLHIPTVGIGAGEGCGGQILVLTDILGWLPGRKPKFVRQYADLHSVAVDALERYKIDVRRGEFPAARESYGSTLESSSEAASRSKTHSSEPSSS